MARAFYAPFSENHSLHLFDINNMMREGAYRWSINKKIQHNFCNFSKASKIHFNFSRVSISKHNFWNWTWNSTVTNLRTKSSSAKWRKKSSCTQYSIIAWHLTSVNLMTRRCSKRSRIKVGGVVSQLARGICQVNKSSWIYPPKIEQHGPRE